MLNLENLKDFINSIAKNDIDTIKIEKTKTQILINKHQTQYKLDKNFNVENNTKHNHKDNTDHLITNKNEKIKEVTIDEETITHSAIYSTIVSPMVGTFYKSPAPNEPPFINVGEIVRNKQAVCIIEAMKLMNEIESEVQGEVVEILVNDGDIVDCGQSLMKIKIK